MEFMPTEVMTAAGKKELGIDPLDIEKVLVVVEPPQNAPPGVGFVVNFSKPYQLDQIMMPLVRETTEANLDGAAYRQAQSPMGFSLYMPDSRTLLVAHDHLLRKMVANKKAPAEGPVSRLLAATDTSGDVLAIASMEPVRQMLTAQLAQAPVPPPFEKVKRIPELVTAAKAQLRLTGAFSASLMLLAADEGKAEELEQLINELMDLGQQMALAQMTKEMSGDDPVEQAMLQYMTRINKRMFEILRPTRSGKIVKFAHEGEQQAQIATIGILVALLLPAVQAAREAARRAQSSNNMKMLGLAMHNYHDVHGRLPAQANFDENGKPLLSWRVHILPFVEQQALYDQFHLDEPWNSEHNKTLIPMMPAVYRNPSSPAEPGKSDYLVPVGEGTLFEGTEGKRFADVKDGLSNTLMALEVDPARAVTWTKPEDWEYDPDDALSGLGQAHPGGFEALFGDGSVRFIAKTIDPNVFDKLIRIADGQVVPNF
jgi:type II secretory pathway pseudopilin PulG